MTTRNLDLVRRGYEAAATGDLDAVASLLDDDVRWHAAGDETGGCQNRRETLEWMRDAITRGTRIELLDARELQDGRVLVLLQRTAPGQGEAEMPPPHGQILSFRDGRITDMAVFATAQEATAAAEAV